MLKTTLWAAAFATAIGCAGTAGASTLVIGGGAAKDCAQAAINGRKDDASVTTCTLALETETLNFRDRARTYVNRGVLQMRQRTSTTPSRTSTPPRGSIPISARPSSIAARPMWEPAATARA
jgi:hypothetical protein